MTSHPHIEEKRVGSWRMVQALSMSARRCRGWRRGKGGAELQAGDGFLVDFRKSEAVRGVGGGLLRQRG
jgi:hypothetical protein